MRLNSRNEFSLRKTSIRKVLLILISLWGVSTSAQELIDISTLTSTRELSTGQYIISGDNTATGSSILNMVFNVASGNTVTIILDNVKFKSNNTSSTKFINGTSGSNISIILKGDNVYDATSMTAAAAAISLGGGGNGIYNISEDAVSKGSFTMKIAAGASSLAFMTLSHWGGSGGVLNISGGTYRNENTGSTNYTAACVLSMGTNYIATTNITGGVFQTVASGRGTHTGPVIMNYSGTSGGNICNILGGTYASAGGYALITSTNASKTSKINISGGTFTSADANKALFGGSSNQMGNATANSYIAITAPAYIRDKNGVSTKVVATLNDTLNSERMTIYKSSLTVSPCYIVKFYSGLDKASLHTQESDVSTFKLSEYNKSWFTPALSSFHEWTDGTREYLNAATVSFAPGTYVLELYPAKGPFRWFVSTNGNNSNDGTSWEKAWKWDIIRLQSYDPNSLTNKGVLPGDTIYFAAGAYNVSSLSGDLGGIPMGLNFIGGYSAGDDVQTSSPLSSEYPVLTTSYSTSAGLVRGKLFPLAVTSASQSVLFKGFVFRDIFLDAPADNGGLITTSTTHQASLKFDQCTFSNNVTNSRGFFAFSDFDYGVTFANCVFSANTIKNAPAAFITRSLFYGLGNNGSSKSHFSFTNCRVYNNASPLNSLFSGNVGSLSTYNSFFINNSSYPYATTSSSVWNSESNSYAAFGLSTSTAVNIEASIISNNVYNRTLSGGEQTLYTAVNTNLSAANVPAVTLFYKDLYVGSNTSLTPKNCIVNGAFYGSGSGVSYAPALNKANLLSASDCSNLISGTSSVDDILSKYDNTTSTYWKSDLLDISYSGLLTYKPDLDGFALPDFGNAGYKNGKEEYPNYQPKSSRIVTVTPLADTNADNTANIQAAIDLVSAMTPDSMGMRGVVYITAGKYFLDGFLTVSASGVVIRGAGRGPDVASPTDCSNITCLHSRGIGAGKGFSFLQVGSEEGVNWSGTVRSNMTHTGKVGDYKIMVEDPSLFRVGDNVCVCMPWTDEFLVSIWYGGNSNCDRWGTANGFEYNRYITAIEGNMITLDAPLFMTYDLKYAQPYLRKITPATVAQNIGLEDFRISMDRTPADVETTPGQRNCIKMRSLENCWAKNLRLSDYIHAGIITESCTRMTIDDVLSVDASGYKGAGNYYSFENYNRSQLILYRNCQARGGRHDYIGNGSQLVSGIALVGFQSQEPSGSEAGHRNFGQGVLFDNWNQWSTTGSIGAFLRNNMGTMHGWGAVHCVMWNCNMGNGVGTILLDKVPTTQNYAIACNAATIKKYTSTSPCVANSYVGASYKTGYVEGQRSALPVRPASLYAAQNYYRWQAAETRGSIYIAGGYASVSRATPGQTVTIYRGNDPDGKLFDHWEVVKGGVTLTGNTFVMKTADVVIKAVYNTGTATDVPKTTKPESALSYINGIVKCSSSQIMNIYSVDGILRMKASERVDTSGWPVGIYIIKTDTEVLKFAKHY